MILISQIGLIIGLGGTHFFRINLICLSEIIFKLRGGQMLHEMFGRFK